MSIFGRLDEMTSRSVDRLNDEQFDLIPMSVSANGRPTGDDDRPTIHGRGIFTDNPSRPSLQLGDRKLNGGNDFRLLLSSRSLELSVDRRWFAFGDGSPNAAAQPRQGDRVRLTDRSGSPVYQISSAEPDGHSRIVLKLTGEGNV